MNSNSKLKKADLLLWIEKVWRQAVRLESVSHEHGWSCHLGSLAVPIYVLIAINASKWFLRAIDKIRRAFT